MDGWAKGTGGSMLHDMYCSEVHQERAHHSHPNLYRFSGSAQKHFDYVHPTTQLCHFTTCNQEQKEHPQYFANWLQLLADLYFSEICLEAVTKTTRDAAQKLHDGQLLLKYLKGLWDPVGGRVMSRDPKTFSDAIDVAVRRLKMRNLTSRKQDC